MSDNTYNGWTNKATWLVNIWIDNDQGEQEFWLGQAREFKDAGYADYDASILTHEQATRYALADSLKDYYEAQVEPIPAGLFSDLLYWALADVDWDAIAGYLLDMVDE